MRTIAIGDIHGCSIALKTLLDVIDPQPSDTIVTLGDYVDRGPDTKGVIEQLIALTPSCTLISLMGNHELMIMRALDGKDSMKEWLRHGGRNTLASYGNTRLFGVIGGDELARTVPREHMMFIHDCVGYHETDEHIFVHANYDWDAPMKKQTENSSFWRHVNGPTKKHISGKTVFVGHTPLPDVLDFGHMVCLDTSVAKPEGWLTAIDVNTRQIWQTNQEGEKR